MFRLFIIFSPETEGGDKAVKLSQLGRWRAVAHEVEMSLWNTVATDMGCVFNLLSGTSFVLHNANYFGRYGRDIYVLNLSH